MAFSAAAEGISIHAPGWGATRFLMLFSAVNFYFNPRTRVGCDRADYAKADPLPHFNPRTRVGCDHAKMRKFEQPDISIHAPGWGATDVLYDALDTYGWISIHAPGWGATFRLEGKVHLLCNFNPRTRVGCDDRALR